MPVARFLLYDINVASSTFCITFKVKSFNLKHEAGNVLLCCCTVHIMAV